VTVGALVNPNYPATDVQQRELQEAAAATGLQIHIVTAGTERDIDGAIASLVQQSIDMLFVANDPFFQSRRNQIVALTARYALAASFPGREFVDDGGLFSYGPNLAEVYRLAGTYAGKVLSGAKPADLPIQLPTKFEFAINLKTAKSLDLTVPPTLLALADKVIE
jgi:putative ABC transport system substrate-binding protein